MVSFYIEQKWPEQQQLDKQATGRVQQRGRRYFLRASARAVLGVGLLCVVPAFVSGQESSGSGRRRSGYFAIPPEAASDPLTRLTRSSFVRYNGDFFETIQDTGEKLLINLLRIEDLPQQRELEQQRRLPSKKLAQIKEESFSLIFRGPLEIPLRQRIHRLTHPVLGEMEVFLVPVGKDEGSRYYEVVFNRTLQ
jgi:hypothetical protein